MGRIVVNLDSRRNTVSLEKAQGIRSVQILVIEPRRDLDFRKERTLRIKVEQDGRVMLDESISTYVKSKLKKRRTAKFEDSETYSNFDVVVITVYDLNEDFKFAVDVLLSIS